MSYVVLQVRDLWRDGCVPLDPKITRADNRIEVLWRLPGGGCPLVVSPWTEDVPLGLLPAGEYEVVLNVDEVIAAVRFVDPAAAPDRSLYERVLVPVLFDGPGAYGSRWATEAEMINASPSSLTFVPDVARPLTSIAPGASASLDGFGNRSSGLVLFVPRGFDVRFGGVIRDLSREESRQAPCNSNRPAYKSLDLGRELPLLPGKGVYGIEVDSEDTTHSNRMWAFVSVTNNDTQHVTLITPQ
ncbi:MAG: hypothetical protein ACXW5U_18980 [Thermoanaerobaculia bacterium]